MNLPRLRRRLRGFPLRVMLLLVAVGLGIALVSGVTAVHVYRRGIAQRIDLEGAGLQLPPTEQVPSAEPATAAVLFAGDSRVADWPTPNRLGEARVLNLGRPGETSAQLLHRVERDLLRRQPKLVILQTGINDLKAMGLFPDKRDVIIENYWNNLQSVIARLHAEGIRVVVLTIFPVGEIRLLRRPIWSDATLTAVRNSNERLKQLTKPGVWVFDSDSVFSDGGRMRSEYAVDDFHINAKGYAALDRRLAPLLSEVLGRPMER